MLQWQSSIAQLGCFTLLKLSSLWDAVLSSRVVHWLQSSTVQTSLWTWSFSLLKKLGVPAQPLCGTTELSNPNTAGNYLRPEGLFRVWSPVVFAWTVLSFFPFPVSFSQTCPYLRRLPWFLCTYRQQHRAQSSQGQGLGSGCGSGTPYVTKLSHVHCISHHQQEVRSLGFFRLWTWILDIRFRCSSPSS